MDYWGNLLFQTRKITQIMIRESHNILEVVDHDRLQLSEEIAKRMHSSEHPRNRTPLWSSMGILYLCNESLTFQFK